VGKPERKKSLERTRRRWENNIKVDLQEVGCEDMAWINVAQDRDRFWRGGGCCVLDCWITGQNHLYPSF